MTGTASTEAAEFSQTYKLGVVPIPTNRDPRRVDEADVVYKTEAAKFDAVVEDIADKHETGPAGARRHRVGREERVPVAAAAQARHPARGAQRQAARPRGDDHRAGRPQGRGHRRHQHGRPRHRHHARRQPGVHRRGRAARRRACRRSRPPTSTRRPGPTRCTAPRSRSRPSTRRSSTAGGLYVLGTERHESRRIDNQLRGRSGRQGDPGLSKFYLSLGDDLMRLFNSSAVEAIMDRLNIPEDVPIESQDGLAGDPLGADAGRAAELRDPQERPQVRRGAQPPAHRHLRRAAQGAAGRRPARADPQHGRRRRRGLRRRRRPPRATRRSGTSSSCGPRCGRSTRWASRSRRSRPTAASCRPSTS